MSASEGTLRLERCPFYRDAEALLEHGIAGIVRVSQCDDSVLSLKASQWLVEYAESLLKGKRLGKEETASEDSQSGSGQLRVC